MDSSLRRLMSTTSLAALAALGGAGFTMAPAHAVSVTTDTTITSSTTDQQSLDSLNVDLIVTNAAQVAVSTATAVILNANSTTLTVGVTSGSPSGVGIINATGNHSAVAVNNITGAQINVASNGSILADGTSTVQVFFGGSSTTITNHGAISNSSLSAGSTAISVGSNTTTIYNTKLNPGDTAPGINSLSGAAITLGSGVTGRIVNDGTISTAAANYAAIQLGGLTGGITNNAGGTIEGVAGGFGIRFGNPITSGFATTISNAGTIHQVNGGAGAAIDYSLTEPLAPLYSSISNTGTISATGTLGAIVYRAGSNVTGSIENSGIITSSGAGSAAITVSGDSSLSGGITNQAGGVISGTGSAAAAIFIGGKAAADITNNGVSGGIPAGRIYSTSTAGTATIVVDGSGASDARSTITNAGGIEADTNGSGDAIRIVDGGGAGLAKVTIVNQSGGAIFAGSSGTAGAHAVNFSGPATAVGATPVLDNSGSVYSYKGAAVLVGGALTPGGGQYGILNRSGGTIASYNAAEAALDVQAAVGGGIDNAGTISGTIAIKSSTGLENKIVNETTGVIDGSVAIAQGSFSIYGGQVNGNTTGENHAIVSFAPSAIDTTLWSGFDPIRDPVGFTTGGSFLLDTGDASLIYLPRGAVGLQHDLRADALVLGKSTALVWNASQQSLSSTITGFVSNYGTLALIGDLNAKIVGGLESVGPGASGEGSFLSIGLLHDSGLLTPSLAVNGTGKLDGNMNLRVYNDYADYTPAGKHVILTTTGNLEVSGVTNSNGTDIDVDSNSNTAVLRYTAETSADGLTGTGKSVTMTINRTGYDQIGSVIGDNEQSLGASLEQTGINHPGSALAPLFGWLDQQQSTAPIQDALHKMLPVVNGAALYGSALGVNSMLQSVDARLANFGDQYVDATPGFAGPGSGRRTGLAGAPTGARNGVWLRVSGGTANQGNVNTDAGSIAGFSAGSWNVTLGGDREIRDDLRLGLTLGYGATRATGDDVQKSKLDIRSYQVAAYGAWRSGPWFATGILGGGGNSYEGERTVAFGPFGERPKSDYSGWQFTMKAVAGMEMYPSWTGGKGAMIQITPYGSLRYSYLHLDSYSEKDGGLFNLKVQGQGYNQFVPGAGVRIAKPFNVGGLTLLPWLRPEFNFDLIGDRQKINAAFAVAPDSGFTTEGIRPARTTLSLGFGVNIFTKGNFSASLAGEYLTGVGSDYNNLSGFAQMRFQF